jgi:hypothetical protein
MTKKRIHYFIFHFYFVFLCGVFCVYMVQGQDIKRPRLEKNRIYRMGVPADRHWVGTGFDVERGEVIHFMADGTISLQKGNPKAYCDPNGYNLKTMQQPIVDENIGSLIGRVILLISIEEDEETGEEIRNEIIKEFYIGGETEIAMPLGGELQLGINELVVEDNEGTFQVRMYLIDEQF